ncbi:MAG: cysteine desulfurase [Clostridia bacterium]|nr:cysteine desulfurase [Clostridia bacterium]
MKRLIYLDNSATTKPCPEAIQAALEAMTEGFGNPSSLYELGLAAENIVTSVREELSSFLDCREDEIYFTSSGSESNNTAIFGAAELLCRRGKHIVTTAIEHSSILEPMKRLESKGYEVTYLLPEKNGNIPLDSIKNAIRKDTILVSLMAVNNETGAILPFELVKEMIKEKESPALLHIDAVQAFGKIELVPNDFGADLVSISAHKIHGIKGSGALYVKKGIKLPALILGGGQEKNLRSGTEAVPAIAAFGAAVKALTPIKQRNDRVKQIRAYAIEKLSAFDNVVINSPDNGLPYILNFSFLGYRSETLLHYLEGYNICVSSGSACSKGAGSHVLRSMGLENNRVDSALRISFNSQTNEEEIDILYEALVAASAKLKKSVR